MISYSRRFIKWYYHRNTRERFSLLCLSLVLTYLLMNIAMLKPLQKEREQITKTIATKEDTKIKLTHKISALNKLSQTPLYKRWAAQREIALSMKYHYSSLLKTFSVENWHKIIKTTISDTPNIQLIKIKILPESKYATDDVFNEKNAIYEQKMQVTILSSYFDTIDYLNRLKFVLPHIFWNKFDYKVLQYPVATVDMEFSVFYEKSAS